MKQEDTVTAEELLKFLDDCDKRDREFFRQIFMEIFAELLHIEVQAKKSA